MSVYHRPSMVLTQYPSPPKLVKQSLACGQAAPPQPRCLSFNPQTVDCTMMLAKIIGWLGQQPCFSLQHPPFKA